MITLFRATNRKTDTKRIPSGSCWTPSQDDAEAYTRNPGHGGRYIVSIEADDAHVLDLRSGLYGDDWGALRDILQPDMDIREFRMYLNGRVWGELESAEDAIDDAAVRAEIATAGYNWVVYTDTYPNRCETWVKL